MNRSLFVVSTAAVAATLFVVGALMYKNQESAQFAQIAFKKQNILERENLPLYGNSAARVTIIEFMDPACEACRAFHPVIKRIVDSSFGQVNVKIRYAAFHPGSDQAVRILEAARIQKLFWPVLEAMFDGQGAWASHGQPKPERIWSLIKNTGIDLVKAQADASLPTVDALLEREKGDVLALKVTRTPTLFVNGKPLTEFGERPLVAMINSELKATLGSQ